MAGRRTLRSGKEFSAFDLAVCRAISPPVHFDAGECLMQRLLEEPRDDDDDGCTEPPPFWLAPASPAPPSLEREKARAASENPLWKGVHRKRVSGAKFAALELDVDATELKHSQHAWQGSAAAGKEPFEFREPQSPHDLETGLGGVLYTQEEVDLLTGTQGFMYISWLGRLTIPLLDAQRRVIAVLGGTPRDHAGWKKVTEGAAALLEERQPRIKLTQEALHHRRAQDEFPAIARGVAHGGGRLEPGEVYQNAANTQLTDELLEHDYIQRIMLFASSLMLLWAPLLSAFYQANKTLLSLWKSSMRWNCAGSPFAAWTFNFGPRAITAPHVDFANLAWGWCSVTALGNFDPDFGGHLILWDLRLVVRFPPGSTLLIPSALVRHSNVPIRAHESRSSITQYTAGSLFRWVRNGCKTDTAFQSSASGEEKAARAAEDAQRWEEGMKMFSVVDDL
ncbi:hypothetical protein DFH09DRAFT_1322234 [Mycena vulgaris]|nr:hypothetical protein DFH09DRAFT_1322234 [Mycena vulgaris]